MLTMVNETHLTEVSPEELAHLLTSERPKLVSSTPLAPRYR